MRSRSARPALVPAGLPGRLLVKLLACLVVALGLVPVTAGASWACSCRPDDRPEQVRYAETARAADVAYVGVVTSRTTPPPSVDGQISSAQQSVTYTIRADRSLRGAVLGTRSVTVSSAESACGVTLPERARVLVTAEPFGLCGGVTTDRVQERAALIASALARPPTRHVVLACEDLSSIARSELALQGVGAPAATQLAYARRAIGAANRKVLGPSRSRVRTGTSLTVPRLV